MQEANGWMKSRSLEEGQVMEQKGGTAGRGASERGAGFTITHMLRSIIPSFVRWTMRASGSGLKKDTHSVTGSDPGETPANPEVSGKRNLELHRICFYCTARKILRSLRVLKANRQKTVFWRHQGHQESQRGDELEIYPCFSYISQPGTWDLVVHASCPRILSENIYGWA